MFPLKWDWALNIEKSREETLNYEKPFYAKIPSVVSSFRNSRLTVMNTSIKIYHNLKQKVSFLYHKLNFSRFELTKGRKLLIPILDILTLGLFRARQNIASKKSLAEIFNLERHYKTLVVNLNRFANLIGTLLLVLLKRNRRGSHPLKHTDSTDLPVCLNKNARKHQTMKALAAWGKTGKGWFYGLKLHLTSDYRRRVLALSFTAGNRSDATVFLKLNRDLTGIFIADAGYTGETLAREFYQEHRRILLAKPRKNMRKLMTELDTALYATRMMVEWNFLSLKKTFGLITSLPRSLDGYLAHYLYALIAFALG